MASPDIRGATPGDADPLASLYREAYRENRALGFPAKAESATTEDVASWIDDHRVYVAVEGTLLLGAVRVEETDPGRVKLSRLAVREDRQEEGIWSSLVEHVEETARDEGYDVVWLTTPEEHPYLPGFYRARGFEVTGAYPLEYRDYEEVVMEQRLG